jgi:biotin synthase
MDPEASLLHKEADVDDTLRYLRDKALSRKPIGLDEALALYRVGREAPFSLMAAASEIRTAFKAEKISLCGIINAKSGRCSEDCAFCAQSVHFETNAPEFSLVATEKMVEKAAEMKLAGIRIFGIVTSGTRIETKDEWESIIRAVREIKALGMRPCASLGLLSRDAAEGLRAAGLFRYHHNLETSRSFYPAVCTTHEYQEDIDTVLAAEQAGLGTCCGGIIGLGESMEQRIELALTLQDLDVDSVPVNILSPRPGTPLANALPLPPLEILIAISLFRFILPDKDIKLCGGKEANLRQLLPLGIVAGANSVMTGDYLTTRGRSTAQDIEMIRDLGLEAVMGESQAQ